jgi:Leucine-rich repeat (LRR) protein
MNGITSIPEDMGLQHLKILDLSENKITTVPKTLASVKIKSMCPSCYAISQVL